MVAVELGAGAQAGEVGAGVGLGHAEGGGDVAPQQRDGPLLLLGLGAEPEQRRADDGEALGVLGDVDAPAGQLLLRRSMFSSPTWTSTSAARM